MNYLEIVQIARKFPQLSDEQVVALLQHLEGINLPVVAQQPQTLKTSGELLTPYHILYKGQASIGLTEYLKQHGFKPCDVKSNGCYQWVVTPKLERYVKVWLQEDGAKFMP